MTVSKWTDRNSKNPAPNFDLYNPNACSFGSHSNFDIIQQQRTPGHGKHTWENCAYTSRWPKGKATLDDFQQNPPGPNPKTDLQRVHLTQLLRARPLRLLPVKEVAPCKGQGSKIYILRYIKTRGRRKKNRSQISRELHTADCLIE